MTTDAAILLFCLGFGFVAAGIIGSLFHIITNKPPQFQVVSETLIGRLASAFVAALGGPLILMRNAILARVLHRRHVGWLMASTVLASSWSICSGILILHLALAFVY